MKKLLLQAGGGNVLYQTAGGETVLFTYSTANASGEVSASGGDLEARQVHVEDCPANLYVALAGRAEQSCVG